ncbi:hypothetical protein GQ600_13114 [Phytophthora cactorum]|nr:hypothetical protein GQ600_13114 [Phytophthora cactorum]
MSGGAVPNSVRAKPCSPNGTEKVTTAESFHNAHEKPLAALEVYLSIPSLSLKVQLTLARRREHEWREQKVTEPCRGCKRTRTIQFDSKHQLSRLTDPSTNVAPEKDGTSRWCHFNLSANENSFKCGDEVLLLGQIEVEAVPGVDFDMFSSISLDDWDTGIGRHKHSKDEKLRAFSRQRNNPDTTEVLVIGELQCSVAEAAALLCCPGEADFNATMTRIHGHSLSAALSFAASPQAKTRIRMKTC